MPVYTVFHRARLPPARRQQVAEQLTDLHVTITAVPANAVKVMFIKLDIDSIFIGGERTEDYARVVAQIRQGRTEVQKNAILHGMYEILRLVIDSGEIQTQIVEIDDAKTVMTNGVLNA